MELREKNNHLKQYAVIVPLFNEEEVIEELYTRLKRTMDSLAEPYELIFVDDGSEDSTFALIVQLARKDHNLVAIKLTRNFGQENSIIAGIKHSKGQEIILIDGDLQDPPEFILKMIKKKKDGFDVVYAVKTNRKESFFRKTLTLFFYKLMYVLSKTRIPPNAGTFSIFNRRIGIQIVNMPENNKFISGLRAFVGYRQAKLTCEREPRKKGKAKSIFQLLRMGMNAFFSFSMFPLRFIMTLGIILNIISAFVIVILITKNYFNHFSNFSLNSFLLMFLSFQALIIISFLIIIGEYVGRIHGQVKNRPDFIVESIVQNGILDVNSLDIDLENQRNL